MEEKQIEIKESDIFVHQKDDFTIIGVKVRLSLNEAANVSVYAAKVLNNITAQTAINHETEGDYGIITIMVYFRNSKPTMKEIIGMVTLTCALIDVCINASFQMVRLHNINDDIMSMNRRRRSRTSKNNECNIESSK